MSIPPIEAIRRAVRQRLPRAHDTRTTGSHGQKPPSNAEDASTRLEKLSRGVFASTFVAIAAVGFAIVSATSAQAQIDKATGNMRPVVVATQAIESGTLITSDLVSVVEVPGAYLSGDANADATSFVGKTACVTIPVNTQLTANLVADLGNTSSLAARIPAGQRAVTVNVTSSSGLSTLLRCGDNVQVFAAMRDGSLYHVASSVPVLALDGALSGPASGVAYSTVTLQVSEAQAEEIISAEQDGTITLVLNPLADQS